MRQELIDWVENVINDELDWSYDEHGKFPSQYHGYGIILEELKEAQEELQRVYNSLEGVFAKIRNNENPNGLIELLGNSAKLLACEAVQVAAMAQKFIECSWGWK